MRCKGAGGQVLGPVSRLSEALAVIATAPCDAALLDINLGHETSYLAAEMLQVREVPFAFLTGSEGDEIESRYAKIPVLRKPFSEMEIESCLRRLMGSVMRNSNSMSCGHLEFRMVPG